MSKANRITRLTSAACEQIQARMLEACRKIASDHGLVIESAGWRSLERGFSFEPAFRISIPAPDGKPLNLDKELFALLAEQHGPEAADFEREFIAGGERFRITGIDPRRPKYPISVESIPDRRGFKFKLRSIPDVHQSFFNFAKIPTSSRQGQKIAGGDGQKSLIKKSALKNLSTPSIKGFPSVLKYWKLPEIVGDVADFWCFWYAAKSSMARQFGWEGATIRMTR